eukprot:TRINITY_DN694_c0_g1_i6.p1 TRINITY_DN694_c0_g1~~TRINITY_DN694_c0_g1_i6.p1  ORF type:complete len:201 (-),score=55.78 TRINITY_DN694_c0_g1_i6:476-1078(-)
MLLEDSERSKASHSRISLVDEPQAAVEKTPDDDGEKNPDEEEEEGEGADIKDAVVIKEEKRLSAAIAQIDNDAAIAPRGAYVLTASHDINVNRAFSGLAASSAEQLQNYFHLRVPKTIKEKTLLDFELEGLVKSIDFLDNISEDLPKGCWSLQYEAGQGLAVLGNNHWPGAVAFHVAGTGKHGYVYFGTGERNFDIGFMM